MPAPTEKRHASRIRSAREKQIQRASVRFMNQCTAYMVYSWRFMSLATVRDRAQEKPIARLFALVISMSDSRWRVSRACQKAGNIQET
jgi:hypothetical protein